MIADGKELIALISEIRSQYNCFDNADQKYYEALSLVLRILRHLPSEQPCDDAVSRAAAINAVKKNTFRLTFAEEQGCEGHVVWSAEAVYSDVIEGALLELPSAQSHDIARDIATIIENEKDMRVILKNAQPDAPDTNGGDIIYRQAAIDALESIGSLDTEADKKYARSVFEALPPAQPKRTEIARKTHACDCISREEAIDAINHICPVDTEYDCTLLDRVDVRCVLSDLSAVQSGIIRCKDCKHRDPEDKKCDCGHDILWQLPRDDNWFCADAERRTDE
jgi:hypothetical protein